MGYSQRTCWAAGLAFTLASRSMPLFGSTVDYCQAQTRSRIAECIASEMNRPGRTPQPGGVLFERCSQKLQPEYEQCRRCPDPYRSEAKQNVEWIIVRDAGARMTYAGARSEGKPILDALLQAQRHNPGARDSILRCANWSAEYAAELEARTAPERSLSKSPERPGGGRDDADLTCLPRPTQLEKKANTALGFTTVLFYVSHTCARPVSVLFCALFSDSSPAFASHTYGPGFTQPNPVVLYGRGTVLDKYAQRCDPGKSRCPVTCG